MMYLPANLKKYRILKELTQEDVAEFLGITPQSVSKWERGESYPDISFLPTLANIFETSVDLLLGMDTIRADSPSGKVPATFVLRLISRLMRSRVLLVMMRIWYARNESHQLYG